MSTSGRNGFVIGIDGGGTRTRAVVLDAEGRELGRAEGGPGLVCVPLASGGAGAGAADAAAAAAGEVAGLEGAASGIHSVARTLRDTASAALRKAGVEPPVAVLHAALAGVGRSATRKRMEDALRGMLGPGASHPDRIAEGIRVGTDAEAAFHDAFGAGPGLLLISGTGSIGWGRGEDGRMERVGGWGSLLGDEGSGYRIGLEALRTAVRATDGRDKPSGLGDALLAALGLDSPDALVEWAAGAAKREIAVLAPRIAAAAEGGDVAARTILARATLELERHAVTLMERTGPWSAPPLLALSGGLISPGGLLRAPLLAALAAHPVTPLERAVDPARGAAELALGHRAAAGDAG